MDFILLVIIAVAIIAALAYLWGRRGRGPAGSQFDGLAAYNESRHNHKEQDKQKILDYLQTHPKVANHDIQKLLNIPDATATRYLQELEQEGKITQEGTDKGAKYTIK